MAVGTTKQFTAIGTFSDSSTQDVTGTVFWTSSSAAAATINGQGLATSVANGSTTISALFGSVSGSPTLTVTTAHLVSITVNPATPRIAKGTTPHSHRQHQRRSVATNPAGIRGDVEAESGVDPLHRHCNGKKGGTVTITATASGVRQQTHNRN
jgi:hypothetical protein